MRKISKGLSVFMVVLSVLVSSFFINFESKAMGYTVSSPFSEPTANENCGYLNLLVNHPTVGQILYTVVWNFNPVKEETSFDRIANCQMDIVVNEKTVNLRGVNTASDAYCTIFECTNSGDMLKVFSGSISNTVDKTLSYGGTIIACSVYGNYGTFSSYFGAYTPSVSVIWNNENQTLNKLISIYNQLVIANENDLDMLAKLDEIISSNASIDSKLSQLIKLQEETNSWLEKIYDKICEALGLEGEESTEDLQGKDEAAEMDRQEDELLNDDSVNTDDLELNLDANSSGTIWAMVDNLVTSNEKVFTALISVLTLGIVALILGR